jgi:hypothetical protein
MSYGEVINVRDCRLIFLLILCLSIVANAQVIHNKNFYSLDEWGSIAQTDGGFQVSLESVDALRDSLAVGIVGLTDTHYIFFQNVDSILYSKSRILLTFPDGFDLESVSSVQYFDTDENNTDFLIDSSTINSNTMALYLDTMGTTPETGSEVQITVVDVSNALISDQYQIILTLLDSVGQVKCGPVLSQPFDLYASYLDSIEIYPNTVQQVKAGESLAFKCNCFDRFGNSLICDSIDWSVTGTLTGDINQDGVFLAKYNGFSYIICSIDDLRDSTGLFVIPGDLHKFSITGIPDTIVASKFLSNFVLVEAQDIYSNRVRSYEGIVWFETSDTLAHLEIDSTNKYQFLEADQGDKLFADTSFIFNTAGIQQIQITDGTISSNPLYFVVIPDSPASFAYTLPDTVTAGEEFELVINNLSDISGNLLTGIVDVSMIDDGISPDGSIPVISSVYITDGSGMSVQKLVKAGSAQFVLSIDTITVNSTEVIVKNNEVDHFEFELSSPQIVGVPFSSPALVTALDRYDNLVADFNAEEDTVTILADDGGEILNGDIGHDSAFVNGVCNLTQFEVAYNGSARFLKFEVQSRSGVTGFSETVEINASSIERLDLSETSLFRGDDFSASITVSNFGSLPLTIDGLALISSQGVINPDSIIPAIPDQVSGNSSVTYEVYSSIPLTFVSGMVQFKAGFSGFYNQQPVTDTTGYLDSLRILSQQEATYVEESFTPAVVSRGYTYAFRLALKNLGDNVISLTQESYLHFASETDTFSTFLDVPTFLPAGGDEVNLFFASELISEEFLSSSYSIDLFLFGLQGGSAYSEELTLTDSIKVETPPEIIFVTGSLSPKLIYRGEEMIPSLQIENIAEAIMIADPDLTRLELSSNGRRIIFSLAGVDNTISPGMNTLNFNSNRIPSDFPVTNNSFTLHLNGFANGIFESFDLSLGDDLVSILEQGAVQIIRTENLSENTPWVNTEQQFSISVQVRNLGQEELNNILIELEAEQSIIVNDSLMIDELLPDEIDSVVFIVIASESTNPAEIFRATVLSSFGAETGMPGIIMNPADNTAVATIQVPALIETSLRIVSPPDALDGIINPRQTFILDAMFTNLGEAKVDLGMARLTLPSGFDSDDALSMAFEIDDPLSWTVTAPSSATDVEISVEIVSPPNDLNTMQPAEIQNGTAQVSVSIDEQLPHVIIRSQFEPYDLIFPGQSLTLVNLELATDNTFPGRNALLGGIEFSFTDRQGRAIDLEHLLLSSTVLYEDISFNGIFSGNRLSFEFGENITFDDLVSAEISVEAVIASSTTEENFIISIDSSQVQTFDYSFQTIGSKLRVLGQSGSVFNIEKSYGAVPADFNESFYNYPNPFNPRSEQTTIVYYLPIDSDVNFDIYTLIGEKVFSTVIFAGSSGGLGGRVNQFFWNGRNGDSSPVREGVYIAVLTYSGGEARTKIAVVK